MEEKTRGQYKVTFKLLTYVQQYLDNLHLYRACFMRPGTQSPTGSVDKLLFLYVVADINIVANVTKLLVCFMWPYYLNVALLFF